MKPRIAQARWGLRSVFFSVADNVDFHNSSTKMQKPMTIQSHQEDSTLTTLTVTAQGQVTLRKDVLHHLGIKPGEKIELAKLPDGRVTLRAARPSGTIDGFLGLLAGKTNNVATLDEINEAAADGWAGKEWKAASEPITAMTGVRALRGAWAIHEPVRQALDAGGAE